MREGDILIDKKLAKANLKIKGGELVSVSVTLAPQVSWAPQAIQLNIVHEDESIIVINKPAGLVVHPGASHTDNTLLNALLYHAPELAMLPRAGILHRLDKNTSGLLVVAKDATALKSLTQQLKKRTLKREYQTIVYGKMVSGGSIDAPIGRHPLNRKRMSVNDTGKSAITHYRILEKYRNHTQLLVRLETGRTHQIRVHMLHIHHPIVGDVTYGGRVRLSKGMAPTLITLLRQFKRQALHAFALGFIHPNTQKLIQFEIPLPEDFKNLAKALREDKEINKEKTI